MRKESGEKGNMAQRTQTQIYSFIFFAKNIEQFP